MCRRVIGGGDRSRTDDGGFADVSWPCSAVVNQTQLCCTVQGSGLARCWVVPRRDESWRGVLSAVCRQIGPWVGADLGAASRCAENSNEVRAQPRTNLPTHCRQDASPRLITPGYDPTPSQPRTLDCAAQLRLVDHCLS